MKVVCIDNADWKCLITIGKVYDAEQSQFHVDCYDVKSDVKFTFKKSRFKVVIAEAICIKTFAHLGATVGKSYLITEIDREYINFINDRFKVIQTFREYFSMDATPTASVPTAGCTHPNKRQACYKPGERYWYCPDCGEEVK
jgi:hypothetical protein